MPSWWISCSTVATRWSRSARNLPTRRYSKARRHGTIPLKAILSGIRDRFTGRPDSEHEQAFVRLVVGAVLFVYLLPRALAEGGGHQQFLLAMVCFMLLASVIVAWIYARPGTSRSRRV